MKRLRLLSISSSYVVALNRRLVQELAVAGADRWDVTAVAPRFLHGNLRPIPLEPHSEAKYDLRPVNAYFSKRPHVRAWGRSLSRIVSEGWDLIHAWEEPFIVSGGQIARSTPRDTPLVFATFQNLSKRYPPPFNWIERYAMNRAAGWIAYGQTIHDTLKDRHGYASRPSAIIPIGVDTQLFRHDPAARAVLMARLNWDHEGPPVIGCVGRFVPEKGLSLLMSVLDKIAVPWRALFLGGGPLEAALREWAKRHGEKVRIVTGVPHDDVPLHMSGLDILAAPSQSTPRWREQLGRMILEAFATGIAVVGSDSGEIPYVIRQAGCICPERDEAAWIAKLSDLLSNPKRRRELGDAGRQRAEEVYAWPVVARGHLAFFERILQERGPAKP